MKTGFLLIVGLLGLTGCSGREVAGFVGAVGTALDKCQNYGFKPGTDAYANCRMTLEVQERQEQQARDRAALERFNTPPEPDCKLRMGRIRCD
jgi:hypothetical protein